MSRKKRSPGLVRSTLNMEHRHFQRDKHNYSIIGTWYRTEETYWKWKPCIVVLPKNPPAGRRPVPVIIPLTDAWRWAMHGDVGDPAHVFERTVEWFHHGILPGTPGNKHDHMRLLDAINDSLRDLITMPPRPKGDFHAIGDMVVSKDGVVTEREVGHDV